MGAVLLAFSAPAHALPLRLGFDAGSLDAQEAAGLEPQYAGLWVGAWTERAGWAGVDAQLDAAARHGATPVVHFYYWGNDISRECLALGCWSGATWKDAAGWQALASGLADRLDSRLAGREAVIVLETEFNKNDVADSEVLDRELAAKADYFHEVYPAARVVLGFGNWAPEHWETFDRAAAASDLVGVQAMRASTRSTEASYYDVVERTVAAAERLHELFGKPVLVTDLALSSYPEPGYLAHQDAVLTRFFERADDLRAAGVEGVVYRGFLDAPGADGSEYFGEGERHFGLFWPNGTAKPAFRAWLAADAAPSEAAGVPWIFLVAPRGEGPEEAGLLDAADMLRPVRGAGGGLNGPLAPAPPTLAAPR